MFLKTKHKPVGPVMVVIFWSIVLASFLSSCRAENSGDAPMIVDPPAKTFVISSPLEGRLLVDGEPQVNAKLFRMMEWNGNKEGVKEEYTTTDQNGGFAFPIFEMEMSLRGLEQFVAKTRIEIEISNGSRELIWYASSMSEEIYGETGEKIHGLVCDLSNSKIVTHSTPNPVLTICRWDELTDYSNYVEFED